jgi:hypothetical protein
VYTPPKALQKENTSVRRLPELANEAYIWPGRIGVRPYRLEPRHDTRVLSGLFILSRSGALRASRGRSRAGRGWQRVVGTARGARRGGFEGGARQAFGPPGVFGVLPIKPVYLACNLQCGVEATYKMCQVYNTDPYEQVIPKKDQTRQVPVDVGCGPGSRWVCQSWINNRLETVCKHHTGASYVPNSSNFV